MAHAQHGTRISGQLFLCVLCIPLPLLYLHICASNPSRLFRHVPNAAVL